MESFTALHHRGKPLTMEAYQILRADLLDILFEGKNKLYGAYDLRKTYARRIKYAVAATLLVSAIFTAGMLMASTVEKKVQPLIISDVFHLAKVPDQPHDQVVVQPPPRTTPIRVKTIAVTIPRIVPDDKLLKPEVPTTDQVENVQISNVTQEGNSGEIVAPPVEKEGTGLTKQLNNEPDYNHVFETVQIEAKFPGGIEAWQKYLERNLNANIPVDNSAPVGRYTVVVSFLVDKAGNISDVKAENDPGYGTAEEAVRVIQKSKQWIPAVQNGNNVLYRQKQAITFVVNES